MLLQITDHTPMYTIINEEAGLLHAHNPQHELLKYVLSPISKVLWHEFIERFGGPLDNNNKDRVVRAFNTYYLALHDALTDAETRDPTVIVHNDPDSY